MTAVTAIEAPQQPRSRRLSTLRLVRESSFSVSYGAGLAEKTALRTPADVFKFMEPFADREPAEVFWLLALDSQHRVIENSPIAITRGTLNSTLVHPREVFRAAIVAGAAGVILCHNHPSGDPCPSPEDKAVTEQMAAVGRLMDIPVFDHVVIGSGRYMSFAESGLL